MIDTEYDWSKMLSPFSNFIWIFTSDNYLFDIFIINAQFCKTCIILRNYATNNIFIFTMYFILHIGKKLPTKVLVRILLYTKLTHLFFNTWAHCNWRVSQNTSWAAQEACITLFPANSLKCRSILNSVAVSSQHWCLRAKSPMFILFS